MLLFFKENNWNIGSLNPNQNILLWIGLGILIFTLGYLPIKLSKHFYHDFSMDTYIWLRRIHLSLVLIMYSCFIIGFIKMKKRIKPES